MHACIGVGSSHVSSKPCTKPRITPYENLSDMEKTVADI